jgi:hypothetical protein
MAYEVDLVIPKRSLPSILGFEQAVTIRIHDRSDMGYYAYIDGNYSGDVASNSGLSDLLSWIKALDVDRYYNLVQLAEHCEATDVPAISRQLEAALDRSPPSDPTVRATAIGLQEIIASVTDSTAALSIDDGVGYDDGTPAENEE